MEQALSAGPAALSVRSPMLRYLRSPLFLRDALLMVLTLAALEGVCRCGLLDFDDNLYVSTNPHVLNGLNCDNVGWAFTTLEAGNWHPLTWLSLQIDATFSTPIPPVVFHRTNLLLHLANVLLLAELLRRLTGALWRSAAVAALFAIHPLHVESVAWVSERKDVLSTFFGLWALAGYLHYARKPSWGRMLLVALAQAASLLAKPMLVTLPCLLLLLDYWPLRRFPAAPPSAGEPVFVPVSPLRLVLEKLPLFLLSAASGVVTVLVQIHGGAVSSLQALPLSLRLANAIDATTCYLGQMFWPVNLAIFYPYPIQGLPWPRVLAEALVLAGITLLVCRHIRTRPYLFVGWFWYLGALIPVIGLVQVGSQAHADRYTYIPLLGLFLMLAWGASELLGRYRPVLAVLLAGAFGACLLLTRAQVSHWQDEFHVWGHAAAVTRNNSRALLHLGAALLAQDDAEAALEQARLALASDQTNPALQSLLGNIHQHCGRLEEAETCYRRAIELQPQEGRHRSALEDLLLKKRQQASQAEKNP